MNSILVTTLLLTTINGGVGASHVDMEISKPMPKQECLNLAKVFKEKRIREKNISGRYLSDCIDIKE